MSETVMKNQIYLLDTKELSDPGIFETWYAKMYPERKKKIDAFRFERDKRLSLGAGILLEYGLGERGIFSYEIALGDNEKPFLPGDGMPYFNLSHSGDLVACAFSDRPVGMDLEKCRHFEDSLIRYVFREEEMEAVKAGETERDKGFTELWTIKESVMKYFGAGLSMEPKNISITFCEPLSARCSGYPCEKLYFSRYFPRDYYVTVCSEYPEFSGKAEWVKIL